MIAGDVKALLILRGSPLRSVRALCSLITNLGLEDLHVTVNGLPKDAASEAIEITSSYRGSGVVAGGLRHRCEGGP